MVKIKILLVKKNGFNWTLFVRRNDFNFAAPLFYPINCDKLRFRTNWKGNGDKI